MTKCGRINVLYQFSNSYAVFAGISVTSLLDNISPDVKINFYCLMVEKLSDLEINKFKKLIETENRHVFFIDAQPIWEKLQSYNLKEFHGSIATYYKFYLDDVLPSDVSRLIYIDSDTIVMGDISELYFKEMSAPLEMALDSVTMCYLPSKIKDAYNLSPHFNAGVILFDMNSWRSENCQNKLTQYLSNSENDINMVDADQGIINIVFKEKIGLMSPAYNLQPIHLAMSAKTILSRYNQDDYYSEEILNSAQQSPVIIHMIQLFGERPWIKNNSHPAIKYYRHYMENSLWKDYPLWEKPKSLVYFIEKLCYNILPERLFYRMFTAAFSRSWLKLLKSLHS